MQVVVLVKYVPEPQGTPRLGEDLLLVREGVDGGLDPGDEYAVEAALQLVEAHGGEVTLVSMGPEVATSAIRKGLSMGAHGGVLVSDPALRGADALGTARVLAAAVARSPFDVVLCGVESTDGYTGTLPMTVAELLGVPSATFARKLQAEGGTLRIERPTEEGFDVIECPLPALATVTGSARGAPVPDAQGHHVRQEQADGAALARRPRPVRGRRGAVAAGDGRDLGAGEGRRRDPAGGRRGREALRRPPGRGEGALT